MDFKLTLTDRKPFSQYFKKIFFISLILSTIFICLYIVIFGFHINAIIGIFVISSAGVVRFYLNRIYFNEPFFMIQNDLIKYRIKEYEKIIDIKSTDISMIAIKDSTIELIDFNDKWTKIKLGFIPEKYTREIKNQISKFAKEKDIRMN
jgi:hypothetical protein